MLKKIFFLVLVLCLIIGCAETTTQEPTPKTVSEKSFLIGVAGLVPAHYPNPTDSDWKSLFSSIKDYGQVFGSYVEWNDGLKDGIPQQMPLVNDLSKKQGFVPVYALGFKKSPSFAGIKDDFEKVAVNAAEELKPKYLGLGVEVNVLYEKDPEDFGVFVQSYHQLYKEIKSVSPKTKVFPIFQLEYTKGKGYLSGQKRNEEWAILEKFEDQMDLAAFTTYPMLDYEDPKDIPEDYYFEITKHTKRKIAFTELAWPSGSLAGRSSSETEQAEFLNRFLELTKNLDKEFMIWTLVHDTQSNDLFGTIGLKNNDGTEKMVYQKWIEQVK